MKTIPHFAVGLAAAVAMVACSKQPIPEAEDTSPPIVREAKAAFATQFSATKSSDYDQFNPGTIIPDWEHALIKDSNRIEVQISAGRSYKAFRKEIIGTKTRLIATDVHQSLTARKNKQGDVQFYLLTLIPDAGSMFRDGAELLHSYTFRDDSGGFTGLAIYSTLEGRQVQILEHTPNRTRSVWFADALPLETLLSRAQTLVAGIRWKELLPQTKGPDNPPGEELCLLCGSTKHEGGIENCKVILDEVKVLPDKPINELLEDEKLKDNSNNPGYWDNPGDKPNDPGDNPGDGGNGGNNGDNPPPPPDTTSTKKLKPETITRIAEETVAEILAKYGKNGFYCSEGVRTAFKKLFGTNELEGKDANTLVRYWESSVRWQEISIAEAHLYASEGWFVAAGWFNPAVQFNPTGAYGHVVMIVPSNDMPYSSSWETNVPYMMDTGNKRDPKIMLSMGFGNEIKNEVKFFIFR